MPKTNPYFPKLPETATVSYYNPETDQNLTFEEWNQLNYTVNPSEIRIINKDGTYRSWKAGVDYPTYGPGFWDEIGSPLTKFAVSTLGTIAIIGTGGAAAPIVASGLALGIGGKVVKAASKECGSEVLEWIGDTLCDTSFGTLTGSLAGGGSSSLASHILRDGTKSGMAIGTTMRVAKEGYDRYDNAKMVAESVARRDHRKHQESGVNYDSNCPVCTNSWPCD